jgi:hypothetical protein
MPATTSTATIGDLPDHSHCYSITSQGLPIGVNGIPRQTVLKITFEKCARDIADAASIFAPNKRIA